MRVTGRGRCHAQARGLESGISHGADQTIVSAVTSRLAPYPVPDLTGRTALVTGGSSGIGRAAARSLAAAGATVVLTSRTRERARDAASDTGGRPEVLDTSSFVSVDGLVERWGTRPLDFLILNAGIAAPPRRLDSADGHELTLATNTVGHVRLAHGLRAALRAASGRVVTVGSVAALAADASSHDLQLERRWSRGQAYARSKLACIILALELPARAGIAATPAHPGWATTPFFDPAGPLPVLAPLGRALRIGQDAADGSQPLVAAALGTTFDRGTGYTGPRRGLAGVPAPAPLPRAARDAAVRAAWWAGLCELAGVPQGWR